jgi:hypothetical protein
MSFKRVSELAKEFAIKIAQQYNPLPLSPEQLSSMPVDKLQEHMFGPSPSAQPAKTTPVTEKSTNTVSKNSPPASKSVAPSASKGLPSDIKSKLDVGAPGLKGNLLITVDPKDPKSLRVDYNADQWKRGANEMKQVHGHNKLQNFWSPNYF